MRMKGDWLKLRVLIPVLLLLLSGCMVAPVTARPPLEEEGEVYLYLQPFPQEARRLTFSVDRISIVAEDGSEYPVSLSLDQFSSATADRQRLVGSVRVPPGRYRGVSFSTKKAVLQGDEGDAALLVSDVPAVADFPFEISRKRALLLSLVFRYEQSVRNAINFSPVFSVFIPPLPTVRLQGYAANWGDNSLSVFDKKSGEVAAVIPTGRAPESVIIDQRTAKAYVAISNEDTIGILNMISGTFVNTLRLTAGDGPAWMALTPDGKRLLVVNTGSRTLSIVDPLVPVELARIPVGDGPRSVLVDRAGVRCYVFNLLSSTISVIDIAHKAVVTTLSTDPGPIMGQFNRKGDKLLVIYEWGQYLSVIDPYTLQVVQKVLVGPGLAYIKIDPGTDLIYAVRKQESRIEVYDPFTFVVGSYLSALSDIRYMTIDGEENNLSLVSSENRRVMNINLISKRVSSEFDVGEHPLWVTMVGEK